MNSRRHGPTSPRRIQLRRVKGWRTPPGAVVVARPTRWGNPLRWTDLPATRTREDGTQIAVPDSERRRLAVEGFERVLKYGRRFGGTYPSIAQIRAELAGRDLACWCPLDQPCHADVLLALANSQGEAR